MIRRRPLWRYVTVSVAIVMVAAAVPWLVRRDGWVGTAADGPWQVYRGAFATEQEWRVGPLVLVPDGDGCYLALGTGKWQAYGDCTGPVKLTSSGAPAFDGRPGDDTDSVVAAVAAHDGGYLAVTRHRYFGDAHAYDSAVLRGSPSEGWRTVARFADGSPDTGHVGPVALASVASGHVASDNGASGNVASGHGVSGHDASGYVAVGHRAGAAVAWFSRDGTRWREAPLPVPPGHVGGVVAGITAGPDGRLVAVGTTASHPMAWVSADDGATWRFVEMPRAGPHPYVSAVVHSGTGYLALGGVENEQRAAALVMTSVDGMRWERDDGAAKAGARLIRAAVAAPDGTVYAVSGDGTNSDREDQDCATAWQLSDGRWTGESLGCDGIPVTLTALAGGRIAGSHWGTLFLRTNAA